MTKDKKSFDIFNKTKTISIDSSIIEEYEKHFYPVKEYTVECMILNEGKDKNASIKDLECAAKKGFEFYIYMATHDADEVSEAVKQGVIE